jgi:hypothetical protein
MTDFAVTVSVSGADYVPAEALTRDLLLSIADGGHNLNAEERIAVIERTGGRTHLHDRRYADLLHDAGCFAEASRLFETVGHWRKVGDCQLALGNLAGAVECYGKPGVREEGQTHRGQPDYDRLLGIAFRAGSWNDVIAWIRRGEPEAWTADLRQVTFANSVRAKGPLLRFLVIAAIRSEQLEAVQREFVGRFGCTGAEWTALVAACTISDGALAKEQAKTFPRALRKPAVTVAEALATGLTERTEALCDWLTDVPNSFARSRAHLTAFLASGEEVELRPALEWLLSAGSYEMLRSAFFSLMNATMLHRSDSPHALSVYRAHPSIARAGIREYLQAVLRSDARLSPADLYICALQFLTLDLHADPLAPNDADGLLKSRVIRAGDWAEAKLGEWIAGAEAKDKFALLQQAAAAAGPWKDVRQLRQWSNLMGSAVEHLRHAWSDEIGETWQSEEITYRAICDALPDLQVQRQARPVWLAPQHLDIYIPALGLAVEYMGQQHYAPVTFFGGQEGMTRTQVRDARKARLCAEAGVRLEYVRFDQDIAARVREIMSVA